MTTRPPGFTTRAYVGEASVGEEVGRDRRPTRTRRRTGRRTAVGHVAQRQPRVAEHDGRPLGRAGQEREEARIRGDLGDERIDLEVRHRPARLDVGRERAGPEPDDADRLRPAAPPARAARNTSPNGPAARSRPAVAGLGRDRSTGCRGPSCRSSGSSASRRPGRRTSVTPKKLRSRIDRRRAGGRAPRGRGRGRSRPPGRRAARRRAGSGRRRGASGSRPRRRATMSRSEERHRG